MAYRGKSNFISVLFKRVRFSRGLNQARLAQSLFISQNSVSAIELGDFLPHLSTFALFCRLYDIPLTDIKLVFDELYESIQEQFVDDIESFDELYESIQEQFVDDIESKNL